jgi:hypothetical protein
MHFNPSADVQASLAGLFLAFERKPLFHALNYTALAA